MKRRSFVIKWDRPKGLPNKDDVSSELASRLDIPEDAVHIERKVTGVHIRDKIQVETTTIPNEKVIEEMQHIKIHNDDKLESI